MNSFAQFRHARGFLAVIAMVVLIGYGRSVLRAEDAIAETKPATPQLFRLDEAAKDRIKLVRTLVGHSGPVNSAQFLPDGKRVVSVSDDGTMRVWQIEDGKEICQVKGMEGQLKSTVLSGEHLALTAGSSKTVYLCNFDSGTVEQTLTGANAAIVKLAISRNGFKIAALDEVGDAYVWDASHGLDMPIGPAVPLPKHPAASGKLTQIAFDPQQALLWASGDFPNLVSWTLDPLKPADELIMAEQSPTRRFCISAEGFHLLAATEHTFSTARRITLEEDFARSVRVPHVSSLPRIERVLPAGYDYFALLGGDGAIEFWRGRDDQFAGQFPAPVEGVTTVTYAPPLKMTLTGHTDGSLSLWSVDALRRRPEDIQWDAIRECEKLLADKKYDELTQRIDQLRHDESCAQTGLPVLHLLYAQLATQPEGSDWASLQANVIEWRAAMPISIAPLIVQAELLKCEGWAARGNGWASTVTADGRKTFGEKLKQALDVIDEAQILKEEDPELFVTQIGILMGAGQGLEAIDAAIKKGAEIDPAYLTLYQQAAIAHLPRWCGEPPAELAKWAGDTCDNLKDHGDEVYAAIACSLAEYARDGVFDESALDWQRIKRGLDQLLAKYDDSKYFANDGGFMAVLKLDHDMARKTLPIIGLNRTASMFWGEHGQLRWQKWAASDVMPIDPEQEHLTILYQQPDCAVIGADGRLVAVTGTSNGGHLQLFDTRTWRSVFNRENMGADFSVLAIHPALPLVAIAGGPIAPEGSQPHGLSYGMEYLDFSEGQPKIMGFHGECAHTDRVAALAFSSDKNHWASGGLDSCIKLWDLPLVEHAHPQVMNLPSGIVGLSYTADSKSLAVATQNDGVLLYDADSKQQTDKLPHALQSYPLEQGKVLATSNAGSLVAYLNEENRVTIYDCQAKATIATLPAVEGKIFTLAFSPDDKLLATGGESKQIDFWDAATGKAVHSFKGHFDTIRAVHFFADRSKLLSLSDDGTMRVWDISQFVKPQSWLNLLEKAFK